MFTKYLKIKIVIKTQVLKLLYLMHMKGHLFLNYSQQVTDRVLYQDAALF